MEDIVPNGKTLPDPFDSIKQLASSRYELFEKLGGGSMGVVYRGLDRELNTEVAIKLEKPGSDAEKFARKAQMLIAVDSPYITRLTDFAIAPDGKRMLVMELIKGLDLQHYMDQQAGPLDEITTIEWMRHVASGLLALGEQGIIHRDIKPANIRIDELGRARLMDFGTSCLMVNGVAQISNAVVGTAYYISPEQAASPRTVDTRSDIYSFGATFYHALTGQPPFQGKNSLTIIFQHRKSRLRPPKLVNPVLSNDMCNLLERCLAKLPDQRFCSFAEVLRALSDLPKPASALG